MISLRELATTAVRPVSATVLAILVAFLSFCRSAPAAQPATYHVWEKVEIVLRAKHTYANPHKDVDVWVNLAGPDFTKRCYGFWDGDDVFRVRVMATKPGRWTWSSGSSTSDPGLDGVKGSFSAVQWSRADKARNPSRRGMIRATANGHAFEFADGTPFFLLGDTWWSTGTFSDRWHYDDKPREIGPNAGFKDYVRLRKEQGFNCIAMIAAFGNWANDGKPATIKLADGTVLRSATSRVPGAKPGIVMLWWPSLSSDAASATPSTDRFTTSSSSWRPTSSEALTWNVMPVARASGGCLRFRVRGRGTSLTRSRLWASLRTCGPMASTRPLNRASTFPIRRTSGFP